MKDECNLLMVPRPPTRTMPNRANGTETVTTLGVTVRMTATSEGLEGMSLEDMVSDDIDLAWVGEAKAREINPLNVNICLPELVFAGVR